ncbi:MAG TPA: DUF4394 domain-containing protein [Pyrinomonadaceae bacterium]|nr:DUF4394 domain-containing protein [Pyrinomonadaceae bacterium]
MFNTAASALPLVGLTDDNRLLFFDSVRPGTIVAARAVTGLQAGESLLGIDLRPPHGGLYGLGSTSRLYRINLSTGAATQVGVGPFSPALNVSPSGGFEVGFDFEPTGERARVVANGQSLRLDPNSGTVVAIDGPLTNAPGEPEAGLTPNVTGVAYDHRAFNEGSFALFGIDWRLDRLTRINPTTGAVTTVGRLLGLRPFLDEHVGFDVLPTPGSRLAFASLTGADAAASRLYVVSLSTGEAFALGGIGPPGTTLRGLAALPPDSNVHAVTTTNRLLLFNVHLPEAIISSHQITGLQAGESIVGIDTRRADGRLYALGSASSLYTLDPETGAATRVPGGPSAPALGGTEFGMSIHPLQDIIRVVSDSDQNLSLLPNGVFFPPGPPLAYAAGDPNAGRDPKVVALAHVPNNLPVVPGGHLLYGIDSDRDALVRINHPQSDNELVTIGPLDLATANDFVGFDSHDFIDGPAYAALSPICFEGCPAPSLLTTIDLKFGRATPVGFIGTNEPVRSIALAHPVSIQFAAAEFRVREGCTTARLLVTRTSTLTEGADFATGPAPAAAGPPASERADYNAAFGRVRFPLNEAVTTIDILVNDDAYVENEAEALAVTLSNPSTGQALGAPHVATLLIEDDGDAPGAANPIDDTDTFVCQHYHDFLSREPDDAGRTFWRNNIDTCGNDQQCREVKRIDTSAAFFLSIEFQETGFFVYRLYQTAFARTPVPIRFEQFLRDVLKVREGVVVGALGWAERLEANKRAFVDEFAARAEFRALYPDIIMSNAEYVDALNANTGGSLSPAERDALVADLAAQRVNRAQALRIVADDEDFRRRESTRAFVLMQYFGYLRRNPNDPPDADFAGYNFWLDKLNAFGGDFRRAEMVKAFINSIEYRQRFGQ